MQGVPALAAEDAADTASPARGREMRNFLQQRLLQKNRAPPLVHAWEFWHDRQDRKSEPVTQSTSQDGSSNGASYEDRLIHLASVTDVRTFWSLSNNFDISRLPLRDSIHLFHKGVKPVWEDPRNTRGGAWTFRVAKDKAQDFWKEMCMLAIGEQLQAAVSSERTIFIDDICGISLSVRFTSILVQVWNRDSEHEDGIKRIKDTVFARLSPELLPRNESGYYYKRHSEHSGYHAVASTSSDPRNRSGFAPTGLSDAPLPSAHVESAEQAVNESDSFQHDGRTDGSAIPPGGPDKDASRTLRENDESLEDMKQALDTVEKNDRLRDPNVADEREAND